MECGLCWVKFLCEGEMEGKVVKIKEEVVRVE